MIQPIVVGGTYKWYATIYKNIVAAPSVYPIWDLTGATVTITFVAPAGTKTQATATIDVAADGTVYYVNLAALFTVQGTWKRSWKISQSGTILESQAEEFQVLPSTAAA